MDEIWICHQDLWELNDFLSKARMYVGTYFIYFWCHIGFCAGEISQEIVFPCLVGCDVEVCQMSMACLVK